MIACSESWTLDGQAGMSKEGDSPDYSYWQRLQEREVRSNRLSYADSQTHVGISIPFRSLARIDKPVKLHKKYSSI